MAFRLTEDPIVATEIMVHGAGGFVSFEGKVRNEAYGRNVARLEYEAEPVMAVREGARLVQEAIEGFGLLAAKVEHRVGLLELGETAVFIQVAAPHRREAFAACEWIIDQLKHRVPIWKKEHYADGQSEWVYAGSNRFPSSVVEASSASKPSDREAQNIGARILLVGLGRLSASCLPAIMGSSVRCIGLCDPATVGTYCQDELSIFRANEAGRLKVDRALAYVRERNPEIAIDTYAVRAESHNAESLVSAYDCIIDTTGNVETSAILREPCQRQKVALISTVARGSDYYVMEQSPSGACINCLSSSISSSEAPETVPTALLSVVGSLMALQALSFAKAVGQPKESGILKVGARNSTVSWIPIQPIAGCQCSIQNSKELNNQP